MLTKPFGIIIQSDNWFHLGWIDYILGSELRDFNYYVINFRMEVAEHDQEEYKKGYQMAKDTFECDRVSVTNCIVQMRILKQLVIT